ncbi:hypothetical protein ACSSS7_004334 [Eimeria intestinalis]
MSHDFEKAVEYVRKPAGEMHPDTAQKLRFYGLYKQATEGDNSSAEPSFYQLEAKQKWKAWDELKGMSKETAQEEYVKELDKGQQRAGSGSACLEFSGSGVPMCVVPSGVRLQTSTSGSSSSNSNSGKV